MSKQKKDTILTIIIVLIVLAADQALKLWVHSAFRLNEEYSITEWFRLHYIENDGIAFGITLFDKRILTLFRILLSIVIAWYAAYCIKNKASTFYIACIALIFAGATGNIIDCVFYGVAFDYAPLFYGRVIDMLYFPLIDGTFWNWIPGVGGEHFIFFSPIFNIADSAITVGVFILLTYSIFFLKEEDK
ncbi:MAG: lipoprotein signal peptidase [Paludibacteraceae bacterium]|nr:lipoprotein signal peptidase [Paludibacteraceae bacterium]MBQ6731787.1 lipoprotein signal peptidase [Paludibacteraceae bacterium]MBQ6766844.1 lipoprotein signal peptidase [Paludibacteraceae bacterium]